MSVLPKSALGKTLDPLELVLKKVVSHQMRIEDKNQSIRRTASGLVP